MKKLTKPLLLCLFFVLAASCWRMPEEDDVSLIPTVNNPAVTRQPPPPPTGLHGED